MTAPRIVVLTDLDDTLFQSERKLAPGDRPDAVKVAHAANGHHSYMTPRQRALFDWIDPVRTIPVTARGTKAFARVDLTFGPAAIVANGAVILSADGTPDLEWQGQLDRALAPHRAALAALPHRAQTLAEARGGQVRSWLVIEPGLGGVYAAVKAEPGTPESLLADIAPALRAQLGSDWRQHINGNNLALMPPGLSKAAATAHLLRRFRAAGPVLSIGIGDSHSDLDFMRLCDLWMTPTGGQLDRRVPSAPE